MSTMTVVDEIRGFNRFYTRVIGLLQPRLADSQFGLTEARVMFELARSPDVTVVELRRQLDLDAGYLSRILSGFTERGLVVRMPSSADSRRQIVRLTDAGRDAFRELDVLQTRAIEALLEPLDDERRADLVQSMQRVRDVLDGEQAPPITVLRAPEPGDLGWVIERHGSRYAEEYGWDASFEALVARVVADYAERGDTAREAAWIAEVEGQRAGCVFCTAADEPDTAQLRLLLVEPTARRHGLGTRLVDECLRFARRAGYTRITLWTNDVLVAARRIYERAGFVCDRREPHDSFGTDLVGEYWSRAL
ncbi:MarR family transcriptional regulator [Mycobacterium sp. 1164985.4]|nr:MarR family transcriptional regulator [Mycobacterium sp. 1164985.4]